jgi:hypothetical protein
MSPETGLSPIQEIQNQRNSFLGGFPLLFNVETPNAVSIRGTFPDSTLLAEIVAL